MLTACVHVHAHMHTGAARPEPLLEPMHICTPMPTCTPMHTCTQAPPVQSLFSSASEAKIAKCADPMQVCMCV